MRLCLNVDNVRHALNNNKYKNSEIIILNFVLNWEQTMQ